MDEQMQKVRDRTSPPRAAQVPADWESSFTWSDILAYLEIYNQRMYPIWPVVSVTRLSAALDDNREDPELCALAFALCASTGAQLRLKSEIRGLSEIGPSDKNNALALADRFAVESERYRSRYDYRESTTVEAILVPLFLHFYYGAKGKKQTTSLLLREAVTLAQFAGLDKEESHWGLSVEEESYRRRTFWLLYVTERGHAMQNGTTVCLSKSIGLPFNDCDEKAQVLEAFNGLVHLFASVDGVLVGPRGIKLHDQPNSKGTLSRLQHELRQHKQWPVEWNEAQRSDVAITQQWLRILLWQFSLRTVSMSRRSADDSMSLTFPAYVSRDALRAISTVSLDALVAHGPGMVGASDHPSSARLVINDNSSKSKSATSQLLYSTS